MGMIVACWVTREIESCYCAVLVEFLGALEGSTGMMLNAG